MVITMAATTVCNLQKEFEFVQQLRFEDFLVDLNQFYANEDYGYEQHQDLTNMDDWETDKVNNIKEPIHKDFGIKPVQEEYKNLKIEPNIYKLEEDWTKKDKWEGDKLDNVRHPVIQQPDSKSTREENRIVKTDFDLATKTTVGAKQLYLKKWDYKPFLTPVKNLPANMLGMDDTSHDKEHDFTSKRRYTARNKYEPSDQVDKDKTIDTAVTSVHDDIFKNWETPPKVSVTTNIQSPTAEPAIQTEYLKILELKKTGSKFSSKVQRIRKRKKTSGTQIPRKKKQKDVTTMIEDGKQKKKSLYKWFQNMKNGGRFHL